MKNRFLIGLLTLIVLALCTACGHKHNSSSTSTSSIRLVNATKVAGLSLTVTNSTANSTAQTVATGTTAGTSSAYASVTTGSSSYVVSGGSLTASTTQNIAFTSGYYYTIVAYERNGAILVQAFSDGQSGQTAPATGYAFLGIGNPAPDAGPLDVYIVSPGTVIDDTVTPKYSNAYSGGNTQTQSIAAGTYDIVVTAYNKPADVRFKWSSLVIADQEVAMLMLLNTPGGALLDGALVQQSITTSSGGAITVRANANARVRLVGAFSGLYRLDYTGSGSVTDSVISNGIGANGYRVVPAGTAVQSVTVTPSGGGPVSASLPVSVTGTPLVAGNEYTLLVYGSLATPSVQLITDNNQAPSQARIRMINVVSWPGNDAFNVISLYNSSVTLFAQPVGYQQVSAYAGLTTGVSHLNAQVEARSSPLSPLVLIEDGKNIAYGGVYTLVMGGNSTDTTQNYKLVLDRCLPTFTC